jgi:hypothetical protein
MSDKATLLRDADAAFGELHEAIDGLGDEAMGRVWLGTWGVREILIHISGWHREAIPGFARLAGGESAPYAAGTYDDFDAWNAKFVARKAGVKPADVLAELDASHREFVAAAATVPDALFAPDGIARGLFDGTGPGHYREHTAQIREWRQQGGR